VENQTGTLSKTVSPNDGVAPNNTIDTIEASPNDNNFFIKPPKKNQFISLGNKMIYYIGKKILPINGKIFLPIYQTNNQLILLIIVNIDVINRLYSTLFSSYIVDLDQIVIRISDSISKFCLKYREYLYYNNL